MNNSPQIALGKSDASFLQTIPEFLVTQNSQSKYYSAQWMVNGPLKVDDGLSQMRVDAPPLIFNQDVIIEYKKIKISHWHVVNLTD